MWRLRRLLQLPWRVALRRVFAFLRTSLPLAALRIRDRVRPTFAHAVSAARLGTPIARREIQSDLAAAESLLGPVTEHYLAHRFDLLGSGWVVVRHGAAYRGFEGVCYPPKMVTLHAQSGVSRLCDRINLANRRGSERIGRLIDPDYVPIDWHVDFISGFRWRETSWYLSIPYGHLPGVDVKVPWELSRLQHLSQLALAYGAARSGSGALRPPETYRREFRNEVLDFIANNPPRYGVNWRCTMDVAIRAANLLVAYDLFRAFGAEFDPEFEGVLAQSVYAHGRHIVGNLEWSPEWRGNHYLADIVGLLFVAAYLPRSDETDAWLAFSANELVREVDYQFGADGANFEASTSYHRLSLEMVLYATALLLGLGEDRRRVVSAIDETTARRLAGFRPATPEGAARKEDVRDGLPAWYAERIERAVEFEMDISKPNRTITQFGDNDSGRFLRISSAWRRDTVRNMRDRYANLRDYQELGDDEDYCEERLADHSHILAVACALFDRPAFCAAAPAYCAEKAIVRALSDGRTLRSFRDEKAPVAPHRIGTERDWRLAGDSLQQHAETESAQTIDVIVPGENVWSGLERKAYAEFGLYVFRSARMFLAIRCGSVGQCGRGGHAHNDQLSFELNVDGDDWITDPGTYVYSSSPVARNQYRSAQAHWGPRIAGCDEPGSFRSGLFRFENAPVGRCLYFGDAGFVGAHDGYGRPVYRRFRLHDRGFEISDWIDGTGRLDRFLPSSITGPMTNPVPVSIGYGVRAAR